MLLIRAGFQWNQDPAADFVLTRLPHGGPISTPDQVRGRLSLENALEMIVHAGAQHAELRA
ncbi:MAG TPA: hypothetical protein VHB49_21125, partial [Bradyrhizobium sp.]|nr:hypothetical protein [Bradyrhizobium sp.]